MSAAASSTPSGAREAAEARRFDPASARRAVQDGTPLRLAVDAGNEEPLPILDEILEAFLAELGQEAILALLAYCVRELISNARKALVKRVWFEAHGLDIRRADDYERGMREFRGDIADHSARYLQVLRDRGARIDVVFRCAGGVLSVAVRNAAPLLPVEAARIRDRISRARSFRTFTDALESALDETEGAGLGIMVLVQFLRKIGVGDDGFSISSDNGGTIASLVVPASSVHLDQVKALTERLVREIESLPHLPESVLKALRVSEPADARISDIAEAISDDASLTADLLRHVNSAWYGLSASVTTVSQAVKLIGTRGVRSLLYSFGFQWLLYHQHVQLRGLQEHALRAAFYASSLAAHRLRQPGAAGECYSAGVLHDLGRIVLASLRPEAQERMRRFSADKGMAPHLLERFSFGMNHAEIGARIAEKWNLPGTLVEAIRWHHEPHQASPASRTTVHCVYLADAMCNLESGQISFAQLDAEVLGEFQLQGAEQVLELAATLQRGFDRRRMGTETGPARSA